MINKNNLWFLTLFSLILILGVYYVTLPSDVLDKIKIKDKVEEPVVKEEKLEKKIKKQLNINCFTKIDNKDIEVICISKEQNKHLANNIMRLIQENDTNKLNITVKFQKK